MRLSIIGSGYVGLVSGISFASFGHDVIFVDVDQEKIDLINQGKPPIYEKDLEELMKEHIDGYYATCDYIEAVENSELTFICVGTPSNDDGSIDYRYIREASGSLGKVLADKNDRHTVVVKSTVLPGSTMDIVKPLLESESGKTAFKDFGLGMNPEFLREGVALEDFMAPDRIVLGVEDEDTRDKLLGLYAGIGSRKLVISIKEAEMIKYVSNAFLATKISFSNEIGNLCKEVGVDSWKIFEGVGLDSRISSSFFRSGIGYGGSCFPKDVKALQNYAKTLGECTGILDAVETVNANQPLKLVELLREYVSDLGDKKIGVLGLAFKPGTDDIRESRAIPIVEALVDETSLYLFDPIAMDNFSLRCPGLTYVESAENLIDLCDVILIATEWPEFEALDYRGKLVFDGRRIKTAKNSLYYEGVCW